MRPYIECKTVPNGYELTFEDNEYFYTSLAKLLIGAAWHIVYDFPEYADMEEITKILLSKKKLQEAQLVRDRINALRHHKDSVVATNDKQHKEITLLKKEIKELKLQLKRNK